MQRKKTKKAAKTNAVKRPSCEIIIAKIDGPCFYFMPKAMNDKVDQK